MTDNDLQHYGVKGMRWGVIRRGTQTHVQSRMSRVGKGPYERASDANLKSRSLQSQKTPAKLERIRKDFKKLDAQISRKNAYLDKALKKDYAKIDAKDVSKGRKIAEKALWKSATEVGKFVRATQLGTRYNKTVRQANKTIRKETKAKQKEALTKIHNQLKTDISAARKEKGFLRSLIAVDRLQAKAEEAATIKLLEIEVAAEGTSRYP